MPSRDCYCGIIRLILGGEHPGVGEAGEEIQDEPSLQVVLDDFLPLHDQVPLLVEARVECRHDVHHEDHVNYGLEYLEPALRLDVEAQSEGDDDGLVNDGHQANQVPEPLEQRVRVYDAPRLVYL